MSRIKTIELHDKLTKKKECFAVRTTTFIKGNVKNQFLNDCIKRECNESKMAAIIIDTYYTVVNSCDDLSGKETNAIKQYIIDKIKL